MQDLGPLYTVSVIPDSPAPEMWSPGEWDAATHVTVTLKPTADPSEDPSLLSRYSREVLRAAYVWHAGILARATLRLLHVVGTKARGEHDPCPCRGYPPAQWYDVDYCGGYTEHSLSLDEGGPSSCADRDGYAPYVEITVPKKDNDAFAAYARRVVAELVADDQRPLPDAVPQPKHSSVIPDTRQALPQGAGNT